MIERRRLGKDGPQLFPMGLGCMGMSDFYGTPDDEQSIAAIERALERGITMLDTADIYGFGSNEELIGKAIAAKRDRVFISTKFGIVRSKSDPRNRTYNGKREYVKASCDASLKRLGTDHIDLYYVHRIDHDTSLEETIGAMAELVKVGKVRYLGISEVTPDNLRKAHAIHPIAALQNEWSLWTRDCERNGQLATTRELGIAFVAYSPLGRGFLTAALQSLDRLPADDYRRFSPRFSSENLARNGAMLESLHAVARKHECTPAQVALAWVLSRGSDVIPIPGTKQPRYVDQNVDALNVVLGADDLQVLDGAFAPENVWGDRYADMTMVDR